MTTPLRARLVARKLAGQRSAARHRRAEARLMAKVGRELLTSMAADAFRRSQPRKPFVVPTLLFYAQGHPGQHPFYVITQVMP